MKGALYTEMRDIICCNRLRIIDHVHVVWVNPRAFVFGSFHGPCVTVWSFIHRRNLKSARLEANMATLINKYI